MKTNITFAMAAVALLSVVVFATGCKKIKPPTLALDEAAVTVSYDKAWMVAKVVNDGGGTVTERGFCFGKEGESPDTLLCPGNENPFSVELSDLSPSTEYTCMAFARNEMGWGYSDLFRFTTEMDTVPRLKTWYVREITQTTAVASGQVLGSGGQTVGERGICYGLEPLPTIAGAHVEAGSGLGSFDCPLTGLSPETRYYARAYAICTKGVYYGNEVDFYTQSMPMEVLTVAVSDVTATRGRGTGRVVYDGGSDVLEYGFCWGTQHDPTIDGMHTKASGDADGFACYFSGLERGQTNYVRAYAINEKGVTYGNELELVPDDPLMPWAEGALPGLFSVSDERRVRFSQGNLQFYPDENLWRFAERQWDYIGGKWGDDQMGTVYVNGVQCDNTAVWKYYEGWVDLFGWGTSGWNNGNEYYRPFDFASYVYDCASYGPVGNYDLTGDYAEADWGVHNTISNGGLRRWRVLTAEELSYLLFDRATPSGVRFAKAYVAGIPGLVLLPDDWEASTCPLYAVNENDDYDHNKISGVTWVNVLEPAGAVFLPAAGERYQQWPYEGIIYDNLPSLFAQGNYWTSTQSGVSIACTLYIRGFYAELVEEEEFRCNGCSVRLISEE